jgi:hypothetical protein
MQHGIEAPLGLSREQLNTLSKDGRRFLPALAAFRCHRVIKELRVTGVLVSAGAYPTERSISHTGSIRTAEGPFRQAASGGLRKLASSTSCRSAPPRKPRDLSRPFKKEHTHRGRAPWGGRARGAQARLPRLRRRPTAA